MTASERDRSPLLLVDTHTLIWMVEEAPRLGVQTAGALNRAARENRIAVSAITPWEIALLVSKNRMKLGADVTDWIRDALAKPGVRLVPLEPGIAVASTRLPFEMHADPADRILVATARHLGATLVTADGALLEFARQGHFVGMDAGA
ncbi:MAG TPA: type II toxin-antitoxin system VapC family toxin [Terracidiphilus sp.]|nr:type II toxin-antitoxin system VapC family toxin [Terracidiphilus sp.]